MIETTKWDRIKEDYHKKRLFKKFKHYERKYFLKRGDTRITSRPEADYFLELIDFLRNAFEDKGSYKFLIELDNHDKKIEFPSLEKFKDYLEDNFYKMDNWFFRYANFGIAIQSKEDLYLIHWGYLNGGTYFESYYYFWNTKKNQNRLRDISMNLRGLDRDMVYLFTKDIQEAQDVRLKAILLQLYIEYYLNRIIKKRFTIEEIMEQQLNSFQRKLDFLKKNGIIDVNLYNTCKEINKLRNEYAHKLFDLYIPLIIDLKNIKLKNYKIDKLDDEFGIHLITAVTMEVLKELNRILKKKI